MAPIVWVWEREEFKKSAAASITGGGVYIHRGVIREQGDLLDRTFYHSATTRPGQSFDKTDRAQADRHFQYACQIFRQSHGVRKEWRTGHDYCLLSRGEAHRDDSGVTYYYIWANPVVLDSVRASGSCQSALLDRHLSVDCADEGDFRGSANSQVHIGKRGTRRLSLRLWRLGYASSALGPQWPFHPGVPLPPALQEPTHHA
ncbi:hypothetical protein BDZ89DRAFT_1121013 [Hymenopellis radicata]|nr:hypothetical protein BDZ89DRAFT_1121013 [Hymenopellis radicata]